MCVSLRNQHSVEFVECHFSFVHLPTKLGLELGLESSESRAWESCSANLLVSLEEHLSNGGLDLNLLKYFALNNAIFRLLFPDSF